MALTGNAVTWFEIPTIDLDRAQRFYELVFEIALDRNDVGSLQMAWFPGRETGVGATGSLVKGETYKPSYDGSMVYFSVDDIEATLERVESQGGRVLNDKMSIGEYGFVAHFEDCEGNRVALHSDS